MPNPYWKDLCVPFVSRLPALSARASHLNHFVTFMVPPCLRPLDISKEGLCATAVGGRPTRFLSGKVVFD